MLIQNSADVKAIDFENQAALQFAASRGHVDVAKVLIQNGADVNAVDEYEISSIHSAASSGHAHCTLQSNFCALVLISRRYIPILKELD